MSRFFVEAGQIGQSTIEITDENDVKHLTKSLRLKIGDNLEVSDGNKWEYICSIKSIDKEAVVLEILDKQTFSREPEFYVTLFQGMPKSGKMDLIIQKTVELGVSKIQPVYMDRSVVTDNGKTGKKTVRWQKIADEAAKQCRRGRVPEICEPVDFQQALEMMTQHQYIIFPYENQTGNTMKNALEKVEGQGKTIAVIIGPEGGFSDVEAAKLEDIGAQVVSLGGTILRTETAAIAALAMIRYQLEL